MYGCKQEDEEKGGGGELEDTTYSNGSITTSFLRRYCYEMNEKPMGTSNYIWMKKECDLRKIGHM